MILCDLPYGTTRFLSTLSLRIATATAPGEYSYCYISIHALLAESDTILHRHGRGHRDFYPRSPCGERRKAHHRKTLHNRISIHALLAESDMFKPPLP